MNQLVKSSELTCLVLTSGEWIWHRPIVVPWTDHSCLVLASTTETCGGLSVVSRLHTTTSNGQCTLTHHHHELWKLWKPT